MDARQPYRVPVSDGVTWSADGEPATLVTCLTCGAALMLSSRADTYAIHDAWHASLASGPEERR